MNEIPESDEVETQSRALSAVDGDEDTDPPKLLGNVEPVTDGNTSFEEIPVISWKRRYFARLVATALPRQASDAA